MWVVSLFIKLLQGKRSLTIATPCGKFLKILKGKALTELLVSSSFGVKIWPSRNERYDISCTIRCFSNIESWGQYHIVDC